MANGDKISVMGALKGGELALLLGAIYPENVKAVVGSVPRVVVRQEISFGRPSRHPRLLWTLGGKLKQGAEAVLTKRAGSGCRAHARLSWRAVVGAPTHLV